MSNMLQVYKLQASILERIDAIRKIFDDLSAADDVVNRINEEELKKYFTDFSSLRIIHLLQRHLHSSLCGVHHIVISLDYNLPNITDCYI